MSRGAAPFARAAFGLALVVALGGSAEAATERLAVLVANNAGADERVPLRYAESDASKLGQALVELGGFRREDVLLLQGRTATALRDALGLAARRVAAWHQSPDARVEVLFYFSGHSDGEALELGRERLAFGELRAWLAATGADVRLVLVDSCKSGALLASKGGARAPAFQVRLTDDLLASGEAVLTSSAADELALESSEIGGSFFTHHLVSGLRGAADSSGDGLVTLGEAYQYAFARTVSATAATLFGPQHPSYDYRLSGQGDLVLATLSRPGATLELPPGIGRLLVVRVATDQVIAEVPAGGAPRVAVAPGVYAVRGFAGGGVLAARVTVGQGAVRRVLADELVPAAATPVRRKGGDVMIAAAAPARAPRVELVFAAGAQAGVSSQVGALGAVRVGVRAPGASGWAVNADVATGRGSDYWETSALLFGGWRFGREGRRLGGFLGVEVGGGFVSQDSDRGQAARSATVLAGPWLGGSLRLSPRVAIALETHVPIGWIRRDNANALALLPAGWVTVNVRP